MTIQKDLISKAQDYADKIEGDLRQNILTFWMQHSKSPSGTFHGSVTNELQIDPSAERGSLLTSRILWTFSSAYEHYSHEPYLEMAHYAYDDLMRYYVDEEYGGFCWSVTADGSICQSRKHVYGQAFVIYALTAYYRITNREAVLKQAIALFNMLEEKAWEPVHGGYLEAYSRDWSPMEDYRLGYDDQNAPKSQNTHLHIMEAYTALLGVWPDPELKIAHRRLMDIMLDKILDKTHPHLGLFFAEDWRCWDAGAASYGHDIEAAWLMDEAAKAQDDPELTKRIRSVAIEIADSVLREGIDTDGAIMYEGHVDQGLTNSDKEWWPQVEAVMGFIAVFEMTGEEKYLKTAFRLWDFCEARLIDKTYGGWIRGTDREGNVLVNEDKISFWKCPYHNGRCGLEAPGRLRKIGA